MVIETSLSREQFIRLSILQHIQRKTFYFYAITCAVITAYAVTRGAYILLAIAWIPFILYLLLGILSAFRDGADKNQPYFLPTRYEFSKRGIEISTSQGQSQLTWEHFARWKIMAQCYVLFLTGGPILAIPRSALSTTQAPKLESLLRNHIKQA